MKWYPCFIFIFFMSAIGCGQQTTQKQEAASPIKQHSNNNPVETKPPNTTYSPAFEGQTKVAAIKTHTPYTVTLLATGLGRPWGMAQLPNGQFLITEKSGFIYLLDENGKQLEKITGLPPVDHNGQGGLLGIAIDPQFEKNRIIYWSFSEADAQGNHTAVAKGNISNDEKSIQNARVIFRALPSLKSNLHFGSRLVFDSSGYLFVSTGERSILEGRKQAQWLNSGLGKIFKITKEGKPAPGNPFIKNKQAIPEMYAYGIRNAQGLAIHPQTGELWETEFGPFGGDELNIIKAGNNYGWPVITYGLEYNGNKIGDAITQKQGMEQPVYYWDPSISPSGCSFYSSNLIPEWQNNLFIGCLSGQHIIRLQLQNNKVTGEERLLTDKNERFRDVLASANGALYSITDSGKFIKISKQ